MSHIMKLEVAKQLIEDGVEHTFEKQVWADLGAGSGTFTNALSAFIGNDSIIYAVDTSATDLKKIKTKPSVALKLINSDFLHDDWIIESFTGVMLANSIHFVTDKVSLLQRVKQNLLPGGRVIVVEYEMDAGNAWVPYPIGFSKLSEISKACGFNTIKKLNEVPSVYDNRIIYSAVIT